GSGHEGVIRLELAGASSGGLVVLAIGAHSDDLEIGCGGTILKLLSERDDVIVHWVVLSASGAREDEARRSAARFLEGAREARAEPRAVRPRGVVGGVEGGAGRRRPLCLAVGRLLLRYGGKPTGR